MQNIVFKELVPSSLWADLINTIIYELSLFIKHENDSRSVKPAVIIV